VELRTYHLSGTEPKGRDFTLGKHRKEYDSNFAGKETLCLKEDRKENRRSREGKGVTPLSVRMEVNVAGGGREFSMTPEAITPGNNRIINNSEREEASRGKGNLWGGTTSVE